MKITLNEGVTFMLSIIKPNLALPFGIFPLLFIVLLASCNKKQQNPPTPKDLLNPRWPIYMQLKPERPDSVSLELAKKYFDNAKNMLANNKILEGIEQIEKSLELDAQAASYALYGDLLLKKLNFKDATKAFKLAETWGFENLKDLYLKIALAEASLKNTNEAHKYLTLALHEGADVWNAIKKEIVFASLAKDPELKDKFANLKDHLLLDKDNNKIEKVAGIYKEPGLSNSIVSYYCPNGIAFKSLPCKPGYDIYNWKLTNGAIFSQKTGECHSFGNEEKRNSSAICPEYNSFRFEKCEPSAGNADQKMGIELTAAEVAHAKKNYAAKTYTDINYKEFKKLPIQCEKDFKPTNLSQLQLSY